MTSESPIDGPGAEPSHVDALPAGTRLAEFEITGLLGVGGFGMVYKAFDHSLLRPVAIKEYMPSSLAGRSGGLSVGLRSSTHVASFESGLRGFLSEARLLAQFDHPSLVKVFRFWEAHGTAYMVMPFYQGLTLKQARAQMRCPPPEEWLRKVIGAMLGALQVLHEARTLHRDVSPDNIFLQDQGPPVLLDLGAARRALTDQTQKHTAILKVNYAPIEQYADAEDMRQGPWTDLYALAAVVYDCLCNKPPAPATFRIIKDRMLPLADVARVVATEFGVHYSEPFVDGLASALQVRPERRPASTGVLAAALGIESPLEGLVRFDWRAELGDIWVPPGSEASPPTLTQPPDATTVQMGRPELMDLIEADVDLSAAPSAPLQPSAETVSLAARSATAPETAPTQPLGRQEPGAAGRVPVRRDKPPLARPWAWTLLGLALFLGGSTVAWRLWQSRHGADADIITETADPIAPAPAVAPAVAPPVATPSPEVVREPAASSSDILTETAEPTAPRTPAAAAPAASKPATKPGAASAQTPHKPAPPAVSGRAASTKDAAPESPQRTGEAEVPAPHPALPPAPAPASGSGLCADANVLTRTMCMYRACLRPENTATTACVEYRRGMQERSTRPYSP